MLNVAIFLETEKKRSEPSDAGAEQYDREILANAETGHRKDGLDWLIVQCDRVDRHCQLMSECRSKKEGQGTAGRSACGRFRT